LQDDAFLGLVLDEVNQPELTEKRIKEWVSTVRQELAQADLTSVG
jgi:flavodoxin